VPPPKKEKKKRKTRCQVLLLLSLMYDFSLFAFKKLRRMPICVWVTFHLSVSLNVHKALVYSPQLVKKGQTLSALAPSSG
jgi:hypothetical protein